MNRAGKDSGPRGSRDADDAFLERLPQHLERAPAEFGHLVEEQHAGVREADLAWAWNLSAANERDIRDRVVRRAERPLPKQAAFLPAAARRPSEWPWPPAPRRT